jgi:membrane protease YdiL (CAAX protease family)
MDVLVVAASFILTYCAARWFGVPAPGSWAIFCAFAVSSWRLSRSGSRWADIGLRMPQSTVRALLWVAVLYALSVLIKVLVIDPLATAAGWPPLNLSRFSELRGNTTLLAGYLLLVWASAAFGEELVFRGFLLTRLEVLLGSGLTATATAVTGQALLFGVAHWYLGLRGVSTAGLIGLSYGIVYVCNGRNLVPLIVAHGLTDSLSLIAIYSGVARLT